MADVEPQSILGRHRRLWILSYRPLGGMVPNGPITIEIINHLHYPIRVFESSRTVTQLVLVRLTNSNLHCFTHDSVKKTFIPPLDLNWELGVITKILTLAFLQMVQDQPSENKHHSMGSLLWVVTREQVQCTPCQLKTSNPSSLVIYREIRFRRILGINGFGMVMLIIAMCYRDMTLRQVVIG